MAFDLAKCNWPVQRFDRSKINSGPVAFLCGRISICGSNYFRDPHGCFVVAAMIKKDFIAVLHFTKIVSSRVIAYAGPTGLAFRDKVRPRIRGWLLFYEPKIFHMPKTNPINMCGANFPAVLEGVAPATPEGLGLAELTPPTARIRQS